MQFPGERNQTSGNHRLGHWVMNARKNYPRITSGRLRGRYLHRAVFEDIAGRPVKPGFHIHHMNFTRCSCPHNLLECPPEFNPPNEIRCPYTGRYLTVDEYRRQYAA